MGWLVVFGFAFPIGVALAWSCAIKRRVIFKN